MGSYEFIETLIKKISLKEGFGEVLSRGTIKAAETIGKGSSNLIGDIIVNRGNEVMIYDPRLYILTGLLYATEPRKPIQQLHELSVAMLQWLDWLKGNPQRSFLSSDILRDLASKFWGGEEAVDFTSCDGAALAAKLIQDRSYVKESLILCDFLWPIIWVRFSEDHIGDTSLESKIFTAVTGKNIGEDELNNIGERIFNLQRAILVREGYIERICDNLFDCFYTIPIQREDFNSQCLVPDKNGNPISRKGSVVDRQEFEKMKSEYYELRGWDVVSGLQTKEKLVELKLGDIAKDLEARELVK